MVTNLVHIAHGGLVQHLCPLGWVWERIGCIRQPRLRQAPVGERDGDACRAGVQGGDGVGTHQSGMSVVPTMEAMFTTGLRTTQAW